MALGPKLNTKPVPAPKVKPPRNNPRGTNRGPLGFPKATAPRIKPQNTRLYHKIPPVPEPADESGPFGPKNSGFGDTGLSGES